MLDFSSGHYLGIMRLSPTPGSVPDVEPGGVLGSPLLPPKHPPRAHALTLPLKKKTKRKRDLLGHKGKRGCSSLEEWRRCKVTWPVTEVD